MGKSPSIADMEKKEDEYREYLTKLEGELSARANSAASDMDARISKFYKDKGWDDASFIEGSNSDFMQQSEWSMANVKKLIDAISNAVFGDTTPPDGVTIEKAEQVGKALAGMENLELYIAGKAFEVLAGIVESFGSSSSVSYQTSYRDEPLGNGFHMFATVAADSYKSTSFFNNEEIIEYLYLYRVHFSEDEAKQQAQITLTKLYEDQIQVFSDKIESLLNQLENGTMTPEQYQSQSQIYNTLIDASRQELNKLGPKASKLLVRA